MSHFPPQPLSLPEEFVLLSHRPSGRVHGSVRAAIGCAAAELGELALRRRILVRPWKNTVLGLEVDVINRAGIQVVDTTPTGLPWADELLAELSRSPVSSEGRVNVRQWFRARDQAFPLHRAALTERGLLRERRRLLAGTRHRPDPGVRDALVAEVRAIGFGHRQLDAHGLFLCELISTVRMHKVLRVPLRQSIRLHRSRDAVPEELRQASSALTALVPRNDSLLGKPRV